MSTHQVNRSWSWTAKLTEDPLRPLSAPHNSNLLVSLGQGLCCSCAVPSVCHRSIHTDESDTHVEWKFPKGFRKGKGEADNYASLSSPFPAYIHWIPFVLGLPTAVPVGASFPGTMVDSCLSLQRLWCTPQHCFLIYLFGWGTSFCFLFSNVLNLICSALDKVFADFWIELQHLYTLKINKKLFLMISRTG